MIDARDLKTAVNADDPRNSISAAPSFEEYTKSRNDGGVGGVGIGNNGGNNGGSSSDNGGRMATGIDNATTPSKEAETNDYVPVPAGRRTSNYGDDGTGLGENRRGEGGVGRTGRDADVEDVDVKTDGEGIALPSSYLVDRDENDGRGDCDHPCASA